MMGLASACQARRRDLAPTISIVIPTFHREERLLKCLSHVAACYSCAKAEVIVIDQTPKSEWLPIGDEIKEAFFSFTRIFVATPSLPAARNLGGSTARADIFLFLDDDVELERSYIDKLLKVFDGDLVDVVGGECVTCFTEVATASPNIRAVEWLVGVNTALRREHFFTIGGYDENLPYNEDAEFCHRLRLSGLRIAMHEGLKVIHYHEPTGGIRHHPSLLEAARTIMRSDLYFTRAIGGGLPRIVKRTLLTIRGESLGFGRIKVGTTLTRVLACALAAPEALVYAFRKPRLLSLAGSPR